MAESRTKGERTRQAILQVAVDLTAEGGLTGLSFGRLAEKMEMSKSGLAAHFESKEALQLATIEAALLRYVEAVIRPAIVEPRGLPRLWGLCRQWLAYARGGVFEGGCFFTAASAELASRPGPARDLILGLVAGWNRDLEKAIALAQELGHLKREVEARQLAFEIHALMAGANNAQLMYGEDEDWFARAMTAIRARLLVELAPGAPAVSGLNTHREGEEPCASPSGVGRS